MRLGTRWVRASASKSPARLNASRPMRVTSSAIVRLPSFASTCRTTYVFLRTDELAAETEMSEARENRPPAPYGNTWEIVRKVLSFFNRRYRDKSVPSNNQELARPLLFGTTRPLFALGALVAWGTHEKRKILAEIFTRSGFSAA